MRYPYDRGLPSDPSWRGIGWIETWILTQPSKGTLTKRKVIIVLEKAPIVTPNCDVIVPSLTFTMTQEMRLLITGPNGSGKSLLFRILSGPWPLCNGKLQRPPNKHMFLHSPRVFAGSDTRPLCHNIELDADCTDSSPGPFRRNGLDDRARMGKCQADEFGKCSFLDNEPRVTFVHHLQLQKTWSISRSLVAWNRLCDSGAIQDIAVFHAA
ncbi:ATP-binding cassette sub-family D member 3-like isoform X2 [Dermacentor andersoni]|uniref:ATP-binding cassette sub-family D member 3-like isoform X2 n=1 Tax=Dermacentor andersoni TaxID=34620 RepID=UPI003B3A6691